MIKFLFVFFIFLACGDVLGQGTVVKKSSDVVVIKGEGYYLHTVESGQTLYSICKAYGVDVEVVKGLNDKKDNTLGLHDVLKIPYTEPFVQQDDKYYYHKVLKGETLYSLSRRFGVKVKRILKFNDSLNEHVPLTIGAVVRFSLGEIDQTALKGKPQTVVEMEELRPSVPVRPNESVVVVQGEKKSRGKEKSEVQVERVAAKREVTGDGKAVQEKLVVKNVGKPVKSDEVSIYVEKKEMPGYISEVVMPAEPYVKVALLLPFYALDYDLATDTLNVRSYKSIPSKSEQFVYFYEGILMAVDSLKNKGYKIDLHVFDTERDVEKMHVITETLNEWKPELIIGPVYGSVFKVMADNLRNKNIPMIYPLSSRSENFGKYPNFVQVNASSTTVAEEMADWLAKQSAHANIISVNVSKSKSDEELVSELAEKKILADRSSGAKGIHFFKWNFADDPLAGLHSLLLPDRENIIVLPTTKEADVSKILPELSVYADRYKITVVGFPEWQTFTSVEHETYYKLNVKFFTYSYVDNFSLQAKLFADRYRRSFYSEPNNLTYKAYDLGLYFIELAAKYRDRSLDAMEYYSDDCAFSRFNFSTMHNAVGKENRGLYIVNYSPDYLLKIVPIN